MKRRTMLLFAMAVMIICSIGVYAEDHVHDWEDWGCESYDSSNHKHEYRCTDCSEKKYDLESHNWKRSTYDDREYNDTYHYACYECKDCGETKYELEKHNLESIPVNYRYWSDKVCNAEYKCKDCRKRIAKPTTHNWEPLEADYEYSYVDSKYHKKTRYCECSQCGSMKYIGNKEKHILKYIKSGGFIHYGCKKCNYNVGNTSIPAKWTFTVSVKNGKKGNVDVPILKKDGIKKYKMISGKKLITVKKKSKSRLYVKTKKKGTVKIRVNTKSGAVFTYVIKIK